MSLINSILSVNNLSKTYHSLGGETKAINNISFNINKGDFICIVGPSGCGKSSILNIISNLDNDYSGNVIIKDNINVSYMFQNDTLFPWLTIFDNALLGLKISRGLNKDSKEYVNYLLKKYNLYEFKDKYPRDLSGGMKQRVA